jgi:hypothetical protein
MSWQASAYVKNLEACADGARMSRGQKLLALILADYHNTTHRAAWPSIPTLAREALTSHAQTKRDLDYLEEHGIIRKVRPEKMGRGWVCAYEFLALDAARELAPARSESKKRVQDEPLFSLQESRSEVAHLAAESRSEVAQKGLTEDSVIRKNKELEQEGNQNKEQHACGVLNEKPSSTMEAFWIQFKEGLRSQIGEEEWDLWLRPLYLAAVMSGNTLLLSLPPATRIIEAYRSREKWLRQQLHPHGYICVATHYPDYWDVEHANLNWTPALKKKWLRPETERDAQAS